MLYGVTVGTSGAFGVGVGVGIGVPPEGFVGTAGVVSALLFPVLPEPLGEPVVPEPSLLLLALTVALSLFAAPVCCAAVVEGFAEPEAAPEDVPLIAEEAEPARLAEVLTAILTDELTVEPAEELTVELTANDTAGNFSDFASACCKRTKDRTPTQTQTAAMPAIIVNFLAFGIKVIFFILIPP